MIEIRWGNDFRIDLAFKNDDASALDLTDCTVYFTAKKRFSDPDSSAPISVDVTAHDDAINGLTHVDITNDQTKTCPGKYFCDFKLKDSAGRFTTYWTGELEIKESITQRET